MHALSVPGRHHVRAGGEPLADLDEGRAQRFQVVDELFGPVVGGVLGQLHVQRRLIQLEGEHAGIAVLEQEAEDPGFAGDAAGGRVRFLVRVAGHAVDSPWVIID